MGASQLSGADSLQLPVVPALPSVSVQCHPPFPTPMPWAIPWNADPSNLPHLCNTYPAHQLPLTEPPSLFYKCPQWDVQWKLFCQRAIVNVFLSEFLSTEESCFNSKMRMHSWCGCSKAVLLSLSKSREKSLSTVSLGLVSQMLGMYTSNHNL